MADLTITAASVQPGAGNVAKTAVAGAAITAGQAIYLDSTAANVAKLADADATATAAAVGIAVCDCASGQYVVYFADGTMDLGATLVVGEQYYVSNTAGGIMPAGDLSTGEYVTRLGIATAADTFRLDISVEGVARA